MKFNKKYGILFWITGLSGSGKTTIAKKIEKKITKLFGPTILISGDNIRKIMDLNEFTKTKRLDYGKKFSKLSKLITNQKINVIFATVSMLHKVRFLNKKNIRNYVEIYIKTDVQKIIKRGKKRIYFKRRKNIVGLDIKPEFPKKPDIVINNNFNKDVDTLSNELVKKIKRLLT
mgnify:CR=1 FL=1|tara:strand:- start:420 stop:941 length:522 start_codon:yes stop_codon:yes gene_type:complete